MVKQSAFYRTREALFTIKRHIYPLGMLLVAISFFYTAFSNNPDLVYAGLGAFCLLLALIKVFIGSNKSQAQKLYAFSYLFLVVIFYVHFWIAVYSILYEDASFSGFVEIIVWLPAIYMVTIVLYPNKFGLSRVLIIFFIALMIGLLQLWQRTTTPAPYILRAFADFYLSNGVFLLFLYIFVYMHKVFDEARAFAENQEKLAESDEATGLPNRRYLQEQILDLIDTASWGRNAFAIVLCTCAHAYELKTNYSHRQELLDNLLKNMSEVLNQKLHNLPVSIIGRWNNDSLLLILPEYGLTEAMKLSEELVVECKASKTPSCHVTRAVFGVASFLPNDDLFSLISRAGKALDKAIANKKSNVETTQGPFGLRVTE